MFSRLAPSPTGYLHLGNARSFLLAWLQARAAGGKIILRIEDLDMARAVKDADTGIVEDLEWLGLDWDNQLSPDYYQSNRFDYYHAALSELEERGLLYRCYCSRKELNEAMSAPHNRTGRYPGTCRNLSDTQRKLREKEKDPALRFCVEPDTVVTFTDLLHGTISSHLHEETGDFIVARADGVPSYQLAVVLDDIAMGITHVLRGDDLLDSTPRQLLLYRTFNAAPPLFTHVPLILDMEGNRLAKRHGSVGISEIREAGYQPDEVIGWLGWSCGLLPDPEKVTAEELIAEFSIEKISRNETRISPHEVFPT